MIDWFLVLPEWAKWLLETALCILVCTSVCSYLDKRRHKKDNANI